MLNWSYDVNNNLAVITSLYHIISNVKQRSKEQIELVSHIRFIWHVMSKLRVSISVSM